MTMASKEKNQPKQEYKVHYTYVIDPEKFRNEVIPVIFDALKTLDKLPANKAV